MRQDKELLALEEIKETLKAEIKDLNTRLEKADYAVNSFIEELTWLDIQYTAQQSGMSNQACGQPSKAAIPTYRKRYDKLFNECKAEAEKALKEKSEVQK